MSGGVTERSRVLSQITDEIETLKSEMEERGSSMTDGSPLVNIRKSLTRMRSEIEDMDVRIGVIQHTLLQAGFKDKESFNRDIIKVVSKEKQNAFNTNSETLI